MSNKILREELIGLDIVILSSTNNYDINIAGKMIDETFHTISIITDSKIKKFQKKNIEFKVKKDNEWIKINGKNIEQRPQDRIKKLKK